MKPFLRLLSAFFVVCCIITTTNTAYASHAAGVDLTYSCLGNNTYQIDLNFYRDCEGIAAPTSATVNIVSASCGQSLTLTLNSTGPGIEVSQLCPSQLGQSACSGGSLPGIEQYIYSNTITLPAQCTDWEISYSLCCRNAAITNLVSPDAEEIYVRAYLNNTNGLCDNSPFFTSLPVPYLCAGEPFFYNHGAVDVDGDSLVYTLVNPLNASASNISYISGFSPTNPMATTGGFNFDTQTGQMNATPSQTQNAVVTVLVQEYRNGVLIGSTMRDMQFIVINCPSNNSPTASGVNGGTDYFIEVCAGGANCFNIYTADPDAGQTVTVNWNNGIPGGTFGSTGNPPVATFCWTPTQAQISNNPYIFTVTVQDDACPTRGSQVYSYAVYVRGLNIDLGPDQNLCASSYTIDPSLSGGSGIYTYDWNTGDTTSTLTVTTSGTYSLTVTDTSGCSGSDSINVILNTSGGLNLIPYEDTTVCPGTPVTFDAGAGFASYSWSTGAITQTITTSTSGIYTVSVQDSNGCTSSDTVELIVNNNLTVDIGQNSTICSNSAYTFDAGPGFATYEWSTGAQTQTITTTTAGTYSVTVYDQLGCSASDTATLTVNPIPFVDLGNDRTVCLTPYRLSVRRPTGFQYLWSTGATLPFIDVTTSGMYSLTLTDNMGCSNSDSVYITVSTTGSTDLISYTDTTICDGESVTLDAGAGFLSYSWSTGAITQTITTSSAGMYFVSVEDSFGCTNMDSVEVHVSPLPVVDLGADIGLCSTADRTTLDAGAGFAGYAWSNGETSQTVVVGPGTFSVTVSNADGCTDSDTIEVYLFPPVTVDLGDDDTICLGQSTTLSVGQYAGYEWSDGSTDPTLTVNAAGTYSVTVTDSNGCTASDSVEIFTELCCFPANFGNLFTLIDNTNNLITADDVWDGKYYITVPVTVSNGATLDLTNVDLVFLDGAGIIFKDSARVRANNSVFRACDEGEIWAGFEFDDASSGLLNECIFKNAEIALNIISQNSLNVTNNEIYNSAVGIYLDGAGAGTYDGNVTGNTFVTNSDIPLYKLPSGAFRTDFFGIRVFNTYASGLFSQNDFVNSAQDQTARRFFGMYLNNASLTASNNNFTNMERAFDVTGANSLVTIEGNDIEYTFRTYADMIPVRITNASFVLVESNSFNNSALGFAPSSPAAQVAVYIDASENIIVSNNKINGFSRGVRLGASAAVDLYNNTLTNVGDIGILMNEGSDYDVSNNEVSGSGFTGILAQDVLSDLLIDGNDVDNLDADNNTNGIAYFVTNGGTVLDSSISIESNCVRNTRNALRLTTNAPNDLPGISNNYLYNYTGHGLWSTDFTGQVGSCANYPDNAGRNSFISNYLSPFGTALDVRSDNTTILVMGNSANLVTNFPNVLVNTSCNTTANASCGNQIGNNEDGGKRSGILLQLSQFKQSIEKTYPLTQNGNVYDLNADYANMILSVNADQRAAFVVNMLRILTENTTIAEAQAFFNAVDASNLLSANDKNWVAYNFNLLLGNYNIAQAKLNAWVPVTVDEQDLAVIEGIYIQNLVNGRKVQDLTSAETQTLLTIDDANRFYSPVARDMVQASMGAHDYKFATEEFDANDDNNVDGISLDESMLEVYPNPVENTLVIRYNSSKGVDETVIVITDVLGRVVYRSPVTFENGEVRVDANQFASGAYIVALMNNKDVVAHNKFIKR